MKLGLLIAALLVAILVVLLLRPWIRGAGEPQVLDAGGRARFMRSCTPVASAMDRPEAYCGCLWDKGVTSPAQTLTSPAGKAVAAECARRGDVTGAPRERWPGTPGGR